jgi:hypothetical protein
MSELEKIFFTSALTIFGSVLVYVIGQLISKFLIDPIHAQKKLIAEIGDSIIFYGNLYATPGKMPKEKMDEASYKLRQQAALLQSKTHLIPYQTSLSRLRIIASKSAIEKASSLLIRLSNSIHGSSSNASGGNIGTANADTADEIKRLLNL